MGFRRPRAKQVHVDSAGFDKALDATANSSQKAFDQADERIEARLVQPTEDLAALVNAAVSGSTFILAPGVHTLTAAINFDGKSDMTIRGTRESIVTRAAGNIIELCSAVGFAAQRVTLEGFTIRGTNTAGQVGLYMDGAVTNSDHSLRDLRFESPGPNDNVAINVVGNLFDTQILNCEVEGVYSTGIQVSVGALSVERLQLLGCKLATSSVTMGATAIYLISTATPSTVVQCTVESNEIRAGWHHGIRFSRVSDSIVGDNLVIQTVGTAIVVTFTASVRNVVSKNVIRSPGVRGIEISGSGGILTGLLIIGNMVYDSGNYGISVDSAEDCLIEGNVILNAADDGVHLASVDTSVVVGNRIASCFGDGIEEEGTCDHNHYAGNHVRGNGAALNYNGTNRTSVGNHV